MTVIRIKPSANVPTIEVGDEINSGQVGWWFGGEGAGTKLTNIANPARFNGTLQSSIVWGKDMFGRMPVGDGTTNSYADLGSVAPLPTTGPFSIMWMETLYSTPASGIYVVMTFLPTGGTQRFLIYRTDSSAAYAPITVGRGNSTNMPKWASAPSLASGVGVTRIWLLTGTDLASNTATNFALTVDNVLYTASGGSGNNAPSLTGNSNQIGAGATSNPFPGSVHNVRMWNRRLSNDAAYRLFADPFVGLARRRQYRVTTAATAKNRMFLAM